MASQFTIGIPTYNRAGYLKHAISSALSQTIENVTVLVTDNASTDQTADIVREFGGKIQYTRNENNVGMYRNFQKTVELTKTEFFSFLQDDDAVCSDFSRRAVSAFGRDNEIVAYLSYCVSSSSINVLDRASFYGPPLALDWMRQTLRTIDGRLITPLSLLDRFHSVAIPPGIAFRTDALRRAFWNLDYDNELYNERIILAKVALQGKVAVDPVIGGIFLRHPRQHSMNTNKIEMLRQWKRTVSILSGEIEGWENGWKTMLSEFFSETDLPVLLLWYRDMLSWVARHPVGYEIKELLREAIINAGGNPLSKPAYLTRVFFRELLPPFVRSLMKK